MKIETNIIISYIFPNKRYLKCVFICLLKIYQQDAEVNFGSVSRVWRVISRTERLDSQSNVKQRDR